MNYQTVIIERKSGIGKLVMSRPEARNAINIQLLEELIAGLGELERDESIGIIFLMGRGPDFCAGMDLKYALDALEGNVEPSQTKFAPLGPKFADTIENLSKPVIAAVHGNAIAGGFILAYFCDLIIATEDAVMGDTHARWGLVPGWMEPQRLARKIGYQKAKELFLTSDGLSAEEAYRIGLVYKVVPKDKLDEAVDELGNRLLKQSKYSLAGIKRQLAQMFKADWSMVSEIDRLTRETNRELVVGVFSPDAEERLRRFVEKRER